MTASEFGTTGSPALDAHVVVVHAGFRLDVRLTIEPGEVVLLTGDNGAGKSTLVRAIAGSLPLDDGRVVIGGWTIDEPSTRTFVPPERRRIGIVQQDARPFPHMTVLENVAFGPRAGGIARRPARTAARAVLDAHGLDRLADRRGTEVSGGEGRRIVLARALATRPSLLLLDEPLSAIDHVARSALIDVLRRVTAEHSTAVLLVTHDPDELRSLAGREIRLDRGRLSGAGPDPIA